jgi:phage N-6-adenine-methyltransferase
MITSGMMTSETPEWSTPKELFDDLDREFGPFDLDPCATPENAKCEDYIDASLDGLAQRWYGRVFMNPPYGRQIVRWVRKAWEESQSGHCHLVVCLLPARTDTAWFHDYCARGEIRYLRGRLHFNDDRRPGARAPFPSMVVVFRPPPPAHPAETKGEAIGVTFGGVPAEAFTVVSTTEIAAVQSTPPCRHAAAVSDPVATHEPDELS